MTGPRKRNLVQQTHVNRAAYHVSVSEVGTHLALSSSNKNIDPLNSTAPVPIRAPAYLGNPLVVFDTLPNLGCWDIASRATPFAMR